MSGVHRAARVLVTLWWLQLKIVAVSAFDGVLGVIYPLFFATTAFLMFGQSGNPQALVYAGLGAAVMGTWSAMATSASGALQSQRWQGTLELLVCAPTRLALAVLPVTAALATVALYSLVATLLWGRFVFGIDVAIASPVAFVVALAVTLASLATFGFLLSVTVVRYRTGWALGNLLEYPGWLLCGFLVPLGPLSHLGAVAGSGAAADLGDGGDPFGRSGAGAVGRDRGLRGFRDSGMPCSPPSCPSAWSTRRDAMPPWR